MLVSVGIGVNVAVLVSVGGTTLAVGVVASVDVGKGVPVGTGVDDGTGDVGDGVSVADLVLVLVCVGNSDVGVGDQGGVTDGISTPCKDIRGDRNATPVE